MTVPIVIEEAATGAPASLDARHSRLFRDVGESTVAIIAVKHVSSKVGDKEIVEAIVVIVADTAGLAPTRMRQTRLASDVGKGAVAIVAEEIAGGLGACGGRGGTGAIHQEDIRPAVVIVVDDRYATTHLFEQKLLVEGRSR